MAFEVFIPKLGANMQEGTIDCWYLKEGDHAEHGDPLFDLVTDKATVTVEAEQRGTLLKIIVPAGETVPIVTTVGIIGASGEDVSELLREIELRKELSEKEPEPVSPPPPIQPEKPASEEKEEQKPVYSVFQFPASEITPFNRIQASPAARKLAKDNGIELSDIKPSADHGIITSEDVRLYIRAGFGRKKALIIGAGEYGRVILEAMRLEGKFEPAGFIDDGAAAQGKEIDGVKVLGGTGILTELKSEGIEYFIVSVGTPKIRELLFNKGLDAGLTPFCVIHPRACVSDSAIIEPGCVVEAFTVVAVGCKIGKATFITQNCSVSHDCKIGDFSHLAPGCHLGGSVFTGKATLIGVGASIAPHIEIGNHVIITPGTSIDRSVAEGSVMEGVPGRIIGSTRRGKQ
ncbi:MAG: NeuD/PglB/VioB family sugar acetyltransferase [Firmicutes bacterium]|nr:NeuD/PglB/VioB family sugar acetyltransferase [Bacillota bacterium]